ncbi:MAG TPA: D-alanyl-D-alanine carboxypeptidase family protein [Coriobacteriia bacterium]|nr:D-alanyl-D-alanine carboxypeptidase family protein [Coriobacteriia bacterium]
MLLSFALTVLLTLGAVPASARAADRVDGTTTKKLGVTRDALPDVSMQAGALIAYDGRVIWSRNSGDERAMASITKIMTAIVAMENSKPDEIVTVPMSARTVGESTSFLDSDEKLKMSELLEALLVKSGNDAAVTVAAHVAGDEKRFVEMMNEKARELGLSHTHFSNSHGLDQKAHYSSAADIGVLARYAMRNPQFRSIVKRRSARIQHAGGSQKIENTNVMLRSYDGANGVKTGWTNDAGYSVVVSAKRDGQELYAVVLGTSGEQQRFADARELLDWGFTHYRTQKLSSAGTVVGEAVVTDYLDLAVPGRIAKATTIPVFDLAGPIDRSVKMAAVRAPVKQGDRVGVATFTQRGRVVATVPLVATQDVDAPNVFERIGIALVRGWRRFTGAPAQACLVLSQGAVSY